MTAYEDSLSATWADARLPRAWGAPTVVSLFSGGGGSSLGYDEYSFPTCGKPGKDWARAWGVVGNSVPPMFMRAIAAHVRDHVLRGAGEGVAA